MVYKSGKGNSGGGGGGGVTSLNSLTGDLILAEGSNITIVASGGNTLTISSTGGSGITYGGAVTTGHDTQVLYIDDSGNLTSDSNFTRDSVTLATTIIGGTGVNSIGQVYLTDTQAQLTYIDSGGLNPGINATSGGVLEITSGTSNQTWTWADTIGAGVLTDVLGNGTLSFQPVTGMVGLSQYQIARGSDTNTIGSDANLTYDYDTNVFTVNGSANNVSFLVDGANDLVKINGYNVVAGETIYSGSGVNDLTYSGTFTGNTTTTDVVNVVYTNLYAYQFSSGATNPGMSITGMTSGATCIATPCQGYNVGDLSAVRDVTGSFIPGETVTGDEFGYTATFTDIDHGPFDTVAINGSSPPSEILSGPQLIGNGISYTFASVSGHNGTESWTITYTVTEYPTFLSDYDTNQVSIGDYTNAALSVNTVWDNSAGTIASNALNSIINTVTDNSSFLLTDTFNSSGETLTFLTADGNETGIIVADQVVTLGMQSTTGNNTTLVLNDATQNLSSNVIQVTLSDYPSSRDDTGTFAPVNFLYTDTSGNVYSSPTLPIELPLVIPADTNVIVGSPTANSLLATDANDNLVMTGYGTAVDVGSFGFDVSGSPQIGAAPEPVIIDFTGPGLNDFSQAGTYSGSGPTTYDVTIDSTGNFVIQSWFYSGSQYHIGDSLQQGSATGYIISDGVSPNGNNLVISGSGFIGGVINNLTTGGTITAAQSYYGDTVTWTDGSTTRYYVNVQSSSASPFPMSNSVTGIFASVSGHTLGNSWSFVRNNTYTGRVFYSDLTTLLTTVGDVDDVFLDAKTVWDNSAGSITSSINVNNTSLTMTGSTQVLEYNSDDPWMILDGANRRFQIGDLTFDWNGNWIDINDISEYIHLNTPQLLFSGYPNTRDDTGTFTPTSVFYPDPSGNVYVAPLSDILPATPDLTAVLTAGAANSNIPITGSDFIQASTNSTVISNLSSGAILATDNNDNLIINGHNSIGQIISSYQFDTNGNAEVTGNGITSTGTVYTPGSPPGVNDVTIGGTFTGTSTTTINVGVWGTDYYWINKTGGSPGNGNTAVGGTSGVTCTFAPNVQNTYLSDSAVFFSGPPTIGESFSWSFPSAGSFVLNSVDVGPVDAMSNGVGAVIISTTNYTYPLADGTNFTVVNQTGHGLNDNWNDTFTVTNYPTFLADYTTSQTYVGDYTSATSGIYTVWDNSARTITSGAVSIGNNTTTIIDDGAQTYTFNKLGGLGSGIVAVDNSGVLSWSATPTGAPGGSDTDVQINHSGAFYGDASLTNDPFTAFQFISTQTDGTATSTMTIDGNFGGDTSFITTDGSGNSNEMHVNNVYNVLLRSVYPSFGLSRVGTTESGALIAMTDTSGNVYSVTAETGDVTTSVDNGGQVILTGTVNGTTLTLDDTVTSISATGAYNSVADSRMFFVDFGMVLGGAYMGDLDSSLYGTTWSVRDPQQVIFAETNYGGLSGARIFVANFQHDFSEGYVEMGDIDNSNNGGILTVDDANYLLSSNLPTQITNTFEATSLAVTGQYTLPTADGTNTQIMMTNGAGVVSFASAYSIPDLWTTNATATILAQTTAQGITTLASPSNAMYNVGGFVTITAISLDTLQVQVTYNDQNGNPQTLVLIPTGQSIGDMTATGTYNFPVTTINAQNSAAINVAVVFTVGTGSVTYDAGAFIQGNIN